MSKYDFSYNKPLNKNYKNILKLDKKLTEHKIPHELVRNWDGWMICYPDILNRIGDVTTHRGSYGHTEDLMEAYQFPECNGDVIPDLTVEDAFKLFENAHKFESVIGVDLSQGDDFCAFTYQNKGEK